MSQRAALYKVAVRPRSGRGQALLLGNLDGAGTGAQSVLADLLEGFAEQSSDGTRLVRVLAVTPAAVDGELFAVLEHGQSGVAADIVDAAGDVRLQQTPADLQLVRSGCLFSLPPAARAGALAVHVNNGRGAKELFERGLTGRFRERLPRLSLMIERFSEPGGLGDAVAANRITRLVLSSNSRTGVQPIAPARKWLVPGTAARVELEVAASGTDGRIATSLLTRFVAGESSALTEICDFGGLGFAEAAVEALLADGTRRIYDLAHPDAGRPATRLLPGIELDADGEPTAESLRGALREALATVV